MWYSFVLLFIGGFFGGFGVCCGFVVFSWVGCVVRVFGVLELMVGVCLLVVVDCFRVSCVYFV